MDDKYLKAIKDELKLCAANCAMFTDTEFQIISRTYLHALDIVQEYERRDKRELEKAQKTESDS